tara:strand:+ start:636 stop:1334 length:699 start_codon:yes stop_codon:yes gene_type:complete
MFEDNGALEVDLQMMPDGYPNLESIQSPDAFGEKLDFVANSCKSNVIRVICPTVAIANSVNDVLHFGHVRLGYSLNEIPQVDITEPCILISVDLFDVGDFTKLFLACFKPPDLGLNTVESLIKLATSLKLHKPIEGVGQYSGYVVQSDTNHLGLFFVESVSNGVCRLGPVGLAPRVRRTFKSIAFWSAASCFFRSLHVDQIRFEIDANNLQSRTIARSKSCDFSYCSLVQRR